MTEKRFNLRIPLNDFSKIEAAAQERGLTVSAYMRMAAILLAEKDLRHEVPNSDS